jgi:hypothetical protein
LEVYLGSIVAGIVDAGKIVAGIGSSPAAVDPGYRLDTGALSVL